MSKRKRETHPPWLTLPTDLLTRIVEYGDILDLLSLGRSNRIFRQAAKLVISRADSLNLSFLALLHQKRVQHQRASQCQDLIVSRILEKSNSCKRLELYGLRFVTGACIADNCSNIPHVVNLELSGCQRFDPIFLEAALSGRLSGTLLHLGMSGCSRIGPATVSHIATTVRCLHSIDLEACSQNINDACIQELCTHQRQLRSLNLSLLNRLTKAIIGEISTLSDLEVLRVSSCAKLELDSTPWRVLGRMLLDEQGFQTVVRAVNKGDASTLYSYYETWSQSHPIAENEDQDVEQYFRLSKKLAVLEAMDACHPHDHWPGTLGWAVCLTFGALREVIFSSCESLSDVDVKVLAATCSKSLTVLEMVACDRIGNDAIKALAEYECTKLAYLDVSACFGLSDEGIVSLCPYDSFSGDEEISDSSTFRTGCPALRSLKLREVNISDKAIFAIGGMVEDEDGALLVSENAGLKKLLMLNVRNCTRVTSYALSKMVWKCGSLVELDARDTDKRLVSSLSPLLSPWHSLRFINGRQYARSPALPCNCCSVLKNSQRLTAGVKKDYMMHCVDCKLEPFQNRGVCRTCVETCHRGHRTYMGSMSVFYCDCAFSISGRECQALPRQSE